MNEKLNLQDLSVLLASKTEITKKDAEAFLREYFEIINEELIESGSIKIKDLGTFKLSLVEDRESINVTTGERVLIQAHNKAVFSPDKKLAEIINEPFAFFETIEIDDASAAEDKKTFSKENVLEDLEPDFEDEEEEDEEDEEETSRFQHRHEAYMPKKPVVPPPPPRVEREPKTFVSPPPVPRIIREPKPLVAPPPPPPRVMREPERKEVINPMQRRYEVYNPKSPALLPTPPAPPSSSMPPPSQPPRVMREPEKRDMDIPVQHHYEIYTPKKTYSYQKKKESDSFQFIRNDGKKSLDNEENQEMSNQDLKNQCRKCLDREGHQMFREKFEDSQEDIKNLKLIIYALCILLACTVSIIVFRLWGTAILKFF